MALSDISYDLSVTERLLTSFDYDSWGAISISSCRLCLECNAPCPICGPPLTDCLLNARLRRHRPTAFFRTAWSDHELSMTSHALDVLYPNEHRTDTEVIELESYPLVEEGTGDSDLFALLERVGPQFVTMYRGAVAALDSDNPDRSRHVLTSFRELWNHLLRKLAPKEEVTEWIEGNRIQGYLHDGRPTRHAQNPVRG